MQDCKERYRPRKQFSFQRRKRNGKTNKKSIANNSKQEQENVKNVNVDNDDHDDHDDDKKNNDKNLLPSTTSTTSTSTTSTTPIRSNETIVVSQDDISSKYIQKKLHFESFPILINHCFLFLLD